MSKIESNYYQVNAEILEILTGVPFFREVAPELVQQIGGFMELKQHPAGFDILVEGQVNSQLYFLLSGSVGVYVSGERVATLRRKGDVIGEMSLISAKPCSATVRTDFPVTLLVMDINGLRAQAPKAYEAFQLHEHRIFAPILAERLVITNEKARRFEMTAQELMKAKEALEHSNTELEQKVRDRTETLERQNLELQQAIADNRALVRILCHDLSNAVVAIQTTAERVLESPADTGSAGRFWQRVLKASEQQRDIIDHVRTMTAIQSGKMRLELKPVNLKQVVDSALFIFHEKLREKNVRLEVQVDEGLSVLAEPVTLSNSIMNNLISNALKFSLPGGAIRVSAKATEDGRVLVSVQDEGVGIPFSLLPHLFSPEKKTSRTGTSGEQGTGFGMPLVKTCLENFGASIQVNSIARDESPGGEHGTTILMSFRTGQPAAAAK